MKKTSLLIRLILLIVFLIVITKASYTQVSEMNSDRNYYYAHIAPGLSAYGGNLRETNTHKSFFGFALKAGVGYVFTPEISVGLDYRIADYPRTKRPSVGNYTHNHSVNLIANYTFVTWRNLQSYALGGVGMTFFGLYDDPHKFKPAFSPVFGAGVSFKIDDRYELFLEGKMDLMLDDEAMDEISEGGRGMDAIGFIGVGVRMNLFPK